MDSVMERTEKSNKDKLLNCPFCSKKPRIRNHGGGVLVHSPKLFAPDNHEYSKPYMTVECSSMECRLNTKRSVGGWNTRVKVLS